MCQPFPTCGAQELAGGAQGEAAAGAGAALPELPRRADLGRGVAAKPCGLSAPPPHDRRAAGRCA